MQGFDRREFLRRARAAARHVSVIAVCSLFLPSPPETEGRARAAVREEMQPQIHTVQGPIAAADLGVTLMHEHVMVDFAGADQAGPHRYDAEDKRA